MRKRVRLISFLLAGFIAISVFATEQYLSRVSAERQLSHVYSSALGRLNESLENISTELKKCRYFTNAAQLVVIANELSVNAQTAKNAISALPADNNELYGVNRFLSQVGDYTTYIAKSVASGQEITNERREDLRNLSDTADELYLKIGEMSADNNIDFNATQSGFVSEVEETEESLIDYPTLIYDGPFSDHMLNGSSHLLSNSEEITMEQAKTKAAKLLKFEPEKLTYDGEQNGKIPGYRFISENTAIVITKNGGYPAFMRKYRSIGAERLDAEQCINRAKTFLQTAAGNTFEESYYLLQDGMYIINFAYRNGITICYPDLIKVGVANDSGEIIFYEANGYIMNHKYRTISTPRYTMDQARAKLSDLLEVINIKQALIPSDGGKEILCYEFLCKREDGGQALMYLNTATLAEERLFLVENTGNGSFTK